MSTPFPLIVRDPAELAAKGYVLVGRQTLEDSDAYALNRARLDRWIQRLPGLRTPRNPDGTGGTPPKEHQLRHAAIAAQRRHNFWSWNMGVGKCMEKGTELLMFDGSIKKVEDIVIGDQLMGPDSQPRNVLSLARGREAMYKVTSTKGDEYTVNESHILSLKRSGQSYINGVPSNKWTTGDVVNISVRDFLKISPNVRKETYKQYKVGVDFVSQAIPLDPYFVGLWLGDGHSDGATVTTADPEIVSYLQSVVNGFSELSLTTYSNGTSKASDYHMSRGPSTLVRNPVLDGLRQLNLIGNKHIPQVYKVNDRGTRLALLAGLIDSDGHLCNSKSTYEMTLKNETLANDVVFLARSLGYAAYIKPVTKSCTYKGEVREGTYHKVSIWGATHEVPVKLERKRAEVRSDFKDPLVCGIKIEAVGEDDYYGFTLDGDHLYLLANFVVTHNTAGTCCLLKLMYGDQLFAGLKASGHDTLEELGSKLAEPLTWGPDDPDAPDAAAQIALACQFLADKGTLPPGSIHISGTPNILEKVWMRELRRMNMAQFAEIITTESQLLNSKAPIFIYDHDFPKLQSEAGAQMLKAGGGLRIESGGTKLKKVGKPMAKIIAKRRPPSMLVIDEIHRFREGSERTRCMRIVRRKTQHVMGLTGTPMDGWVHHVATILELIYGPETRMFPFTAEDFAKRFTKTKVVNTDIATGRETADEKERPVPGINHMQLPAFLHTTGPLMHRLKEDDDEVQANVVYPPVKDHTIIVPMDLKQQLLYKDVHKKGMAGAFESLAAGTTSRGQLRKNMLLLMNMLRMASSAPWELGYTHDQTALVAAVVDIVAAHSAEGRKGLIGTEFIGESRMIHKALIDAGIGGIRLYATDEQLTARKSMSQEKRQELIDQFEDDPSMRFLVCNKALIAEGLNLAETASYTICTSHGYRANIEDQWLARVARPGQQWPHVDAYTLLNEDTIDIYINQLMRAKKAANRGNIDMDFSISDTLDAAATIDPIELAQMLADAA